MQIDFIENINHFNLGRHFMKYLTTLVAAGLFICMTGSAYAADSSATSIPSSASTTAATPAAMPTDAPATATPAPAPVAQAEDSAPAKHVEDSAPAAQKTHHATHHAATRHAPCKKDKKGHCAKAPRTVKAPLSGEVVRRREWMGTPNSTNNASTKD